MVLVVGTVTDMDNGNSGSGVCNCNCDICGDCNSVLGARGECKNISNISKV